MFNISFPSLSALIKWDLPEFLDVFNSTFVLEAVISIVDCLGEMLLLH